MVTSPVHAAAILILPSLATNVWQMLAGPRLGTVARRLWPMLLALCLATWAGCGLMTGATARYGTTILGCALALYAATSLAEIALPHPREWEWVLSPVVGAVTGVITAATGVFAIPAVPYLQAIGLNKEEFIQALGLSFTVSTLALAINVGVEGGIDTSILGETVGALALASLGMAAGQAARMRMSPASFRRWFLVGLLLLGLYQAVRALV
jgi:uncharacterized membrane protein YfcA